ncbi:type IV secretion system protein VirB11 [Azospirillum oryzae]|uniref:Type IV secretion system protein n=1 Tax=Azospirillum oryzae TaxID=286727 RepID=A0A1X7EZA3_9PROT|nr:P-type DNA transfer ATPase VirB11 [Azospirillum oryzae]SMF42955.1 type IV secretion system protein VirB11 [Azospirillum oryzae]
MTRPAIRLGTRPGETTLRLLLEPLTALLADKEVTELVVNRPGEAGVERAGVWSWHALPDLGFERLDAIATLCAALSQQDVGPQQPLCASVLPDGERVQIARPPAVAAGTLSLTIRRPSRSTPTVAALAAGGLFARTRPSSRQPSPADARLRALHRAQDWQRFFPLAVQTKKTVVVTGDTGSGKTTVAKALIGAIPPDERLITIEDTAEFIGLPQRNRVALFYSKGGQGVAPVGPEALIEAALRMRPDRILMQELRDGAAFTFLRALAAGHPGGITTCHAGSAAGAFDALRLMVKQNEAGRHIADADLHALLRRHIDVIAQCRRDADGFAIEEVFFDPAAGAPPGDAPADAVSIRAAG